MADKKQKKYQPLVPPWILGVFVFALLTVLVLLQTSNIWKGWTIETAGDTLTLYALSSLNFVAFVIFAFIFVRSLLKLSRERRAAEVGSQIKTRLLKYFFAVSILPIIAMAVFSYLFWNRAIDRWLSDIPENVVRQARDVQSQAIEDQNLKLIETTKMLAALLDNQEINDEKLRQLVEQGNLTRIEVVSSTGDTLFAENEKNLNDERRMELNQTLVYIRQNNTDAPELSDGKRFDAATIEMSGGRRLIVVPDWRPDANVNQTIEKSLYELDKLKSAQITVRGFGLSTLGLLTFLLIFASSWAAFYVARGLTVPVKALAESSDEIARGNFAHRIDVFAEDELAMLVSAFNKMAAQLEASSGELLERRRYIETILQSLSTGVISFDAENKLTTINQSAVQMLRLEDANFENLQLSALVNQENLAVLEKLLARAKRIGYATEQTNLKREYTDGSRDANESLPVALTATALPRTPEGFSTGVVLVIEDLTELLNAQRASAWQEVARRMAHEIKNPLTPIQLSAERIAKRFAESNQLAFVSATSEIQNPKSKIQNVIDESTNTILREVNSLKMMVDEFSRFARLPNAKLESENINDIISQAIALYEDRLEEVKIEANLAENLPAAMLDEEQLRRVFVNLIENAAEAFDKSQKDKKIYVRSRHDENRDSIFVEIADNGAGIQPSDYQKLFQPYFSTKLRGTGLGLAIVQRIIIEHGGKIHAVPNVPKGAKFIIELPVTNA